jgi:hypothetical protein
VDALHTWAKKRFVESFIAFGEREHDQFLLPSGELKELLAGRCGKEGSPTCLP